MKPATSGLSVFAAEEIKVMEFSNLRSFDSTRPSDKRQRGERRAGYDWSVSRSKWVWKERAIDKDSDLYLEKVTDLETGEVIHHDEGPLSAHRGHGSAKRSNPAADTGSDEVSTNDRNR